MVGDQLVLFDQLSHGIDQVERLLSFLLVDNLDAKAGVYENIVAHLCRRHKSQRHGALDAHHVDGRLEVVVAFDHFTGNGKAHNVPLLYALRWIGA